jgi:hypothetical protein
MALGLPSARGVGRSASGVRVVAGAGRRHGLLVGVGGRLCLVGRMTGGAAEFRRAVGGPSAVSPLRVYRSERGGRRNR